MDHLPALPEPKPERNPMSVYRIILADDHVMMREGIKSMIDAVSGLAVIGEAGDGLQLLKMLKKSLPDMVILDISMPGLRGIEAAREIHALYPEIHILMLSMHKSEEFLSMALAGGAKGYLLKEDSGDELLQAIDQIRKGETYLSKRLASAFPSAIISICKGNQPTVPDSLTPRERQVLQMIAEGNTDRQISDQLCISVRTVHRHHANIRLKLNLKRTADLVRYAIAQGYTTNVP
jgi:DNA-binding NarL/FixJ family response regulator